MTWLPTGFQYPAEVAIGTGHHLRPIRGTDVFLDYPAVMGSQPRLWSMFGRRWRWPSPTMTIGQDLDDLVRHEKEMESLQSFNYCILDQQESQLLGCVYIDTPDGALPDEVDADICWWVVDAALKTELEPYLGTFVRRWISEAWPFIEPRFGLWWHS